MPSTSLSDTEHKEEPRKRFSGVLGVKSKKRSAKTGSEGASPALFPISSRLHTFWVFYSKEDQYFRGENSRHSTNHYKRSILTFRGTGSRWSFRCLPTQTILFPVVKLGFMVLWFIFSIPQNPVIFCRKTELNFSLITE